MVRTVSLFSFLCFALISVSEARGATYNCASFTVPGGPATPWGYNNTGMISGYYQAAGTFHGFILDAAGTFTTIDPPGTTRTYLYAINNNGVAAGTYYTANSSVPNFFTATASGIITPVVALPPYTIKYLYGINDNGAISAVVADASGNDSFAIVNRDGTLTLVPGYHGQYDSQNVSLPGALNNSLQMLETGSDFPVTAGSTNLANANGALTTIQYPYPASDNSISPTYGLNILDTVVGWLDLNVPGTVDRVGYIRDSSGVYSEVMCPGVPAGRALPVAINDNGVILIQPGPYVGPSYIATPISGAAQVSLSATSLTFPPQPDGRTSAPQTVTLTNTGNARLDIAQILVAVGQTPAVNFNVSSCATTNGNSGPVVSLNPGDTCAITVSVTGSQPSGASGTITIDDSAPGAPQTIALSVIGTSSSPPSCTLYSVSGNPASAQFTAVDTNSGLAGIQLISSNNANVTIPGFTAGTTAPVNFSATQIDAARQSGVSFLVTNTAGAPTSCGTTFGGAAQWISLGGSIRGNVAVVTNIDGRLEAFARAPDNSVWHIFQNAPDGAWLGWEGLGGRVTSDPAVALNANGIVQVFAIGTDGSIWVNAQTSAGVDNWTGWSSLQFPATSDIATTIDGDQNVNVFARGSDYALWYATQPAGGGAFSAPVSLGGYITGDPAAGLASNMQAFAKGRTEQCGARSRRRRDRTGIRGSVWEGALQTTSRSP